MKAIKTRFSGPTNTAGSRYVASAGGRRVTVSRDYALDDGPNHARAAAAIAVKLGWVGEFVGGCNPDYSWSWVPMESQRFAVARVVDGSFTVEVQS